MLQSRLRQGSNRLNQVLQTPISCEVADDGDAALRTVPKSVVNAYVLLTRAIPLPVSHPSFEDFSDLSVTNGHFFDAEYFQRRPMQHLLYRS